MIAVLHLPLAFIAFASFIALLVLIVIVAVNAERPVSKKGEWPND